MPKVGILRGPSLNPYEGQCFEKLPRYGFEPVGITTYDNPNLSEIHFPVRIGHNFRTLTKGRLRPLLVGIGKLTGYNFESWNLQVYGLKKMVNDVDLIYSADMWYPYTCQAVKTKIPTVILEWENIPNHPKGRPYSKIKKYNRDHASHFIAVTQKAKEALLIEGVDSNKISVVPAGIDCENFKPAEKDSRLLQKLGVSKDSVVILFVGRLVPEKGILDLINAFSKLEKKVPGVELLVVGTGSSVMKQRIENLILNLYLQTKVKFLGNVLYSEMPQIHNLADVFCLPSFPTKTWAEQFGFSMVEAMACRKPVVSTTTGSIPEVVKDNFTGILVKPNSPEELESALEELVVNKKKRELFGVNGRELVLDKFEANKIASQLTDIFVKFI